jgi:hypothetical protein
MNRHLAIAAVAVGFVALALVFFGGCKPAGESDAAAVTEAPPDPDLGGPQFFEDVTPATGIDFTYRNGEEVQPPHLAILESLGGGLAVIDYDRDGLPDLFLVGGGHFGGQDNKQILGHSCKLYRNLGDFKFQDVTAELGLDKLAGGQPWFYSHGAAVGDYDRDGWPDLLVTGWGRVALFHNEPDGKGGRKFVDVSAAAGLDRGITWATSAAFADFDGDGFSDLYVCQYVNWSFANHPPCNYDGKTPDVCPPKTFKGLPGKVFLNTGRPDGTRTFVDVSEEAGLVLKSKAETGAKVGVESSKSLGVLVVDINGDGKPDVYVANDTDPNFLYVNKSGPGKIRFEERGMLSAVALDGAGQPNGSMGVDAGDPEGTGKPAIWVTNYENEFHALYRNASTREQARFVYATQASGVGVIGQKFVGWGTGFADFNLDGWEDIFIADGHAIRYPTGATRRQFPVLFLNRDGKFKHVSSRGGPYFQQQHLSRGIVLADLDNDGRLDVVVSHMNDPVTVLKNVLPKEDRHWVGIELAGEGNRDVVGARVTVEAGGRTQTRFAKGGCSYASSPDRRFVVGLGTAAQIMKLAVDWPDGTRQEWTNVPTDRYHLVTQGQKDLATPPRKKE